MNYSSETLFISVFLPLLIFFNDFALATVRYDMRQTGDTNIQIDMKDVFVVALTDGELSDDDYNYDYSDLTIKPETVSLVPETKPTETNIANSSKPVNTTTGANVTEFYPLNTQNFQIPVMVVTDGKKRYVPSGQFRLKNGEEKGRECLQGFFLDSKNRCRRIKGYRQRQRPALPFGLRFASRPGQDDEKGS